MNQQDSLFQHNNGVALPLEHAEVNYHPQFIKRDNYYFDQLLPQINWQQDTLPMYGKDVLIPRMNAWYGDKEAAYGYSGMRLQRNEWLPILVTLKQQIEQHFDLTFNSVLANYYRDGQDSVGWHSDDEQELGKNPVIASLSFGDARRFSLRQKDAKQSSPVHIDLESGSLLIMKGETQHYWQHQIAKTTQASNHGRINLTFRKIMPQ